MECLKFVGKNRKFFLFKMVSAMLEHYFISCYSSSDDKFEHEQGGHSNIHRRIIQGGSDLR